MHRSLLCHALASDMASSRGAAPRYTPRCRLSTRARVERIMMVVHMVPDPNTPQPERQQSQHEASIMNPLSTAEETFSSLPLSAWIRDVGGLTERRGYSQASDDIPITGTCDFAIAALS
ncbi:hypothetical protein NQZ68_005868 [Dissostichus eleginoides]|nr:hypothetical protein NQZ68_005868 [Dissostichus eleginoides]